MLVTERAGSSRALSSSPHPLPPQVGVDDDYLDESRLAINFAAGLSGGSFLLQRLAEEGSSGSGSPSSALFFDQPAELEFCGKVTSASGLSRPPASHVPRSLIPARALVPAPCSSRPCTR